ncbi:MAG: hypothetical protein EXQ70_05330 [Solirubrobacterales bacterium]|nr:hypothetical protein [Solirubrobacterales bacterium]
MSSPQPAPAEPSAGNPDARLLARLRADLDAALAPRLAPGSPVALVGIPLWTNVGDHAIFLGTVRWLERHGHSLVHAVSDEADYSAKALRRSLGEGGTILLAGGGTLGDTWPRRQRFRERVLADNLELAVVQLPQSVHFDDPAAATRAAEALRAHPRLTVMARDADSAERARRLGLDPVMAPDMAFALDAIPRRTASGAGVVLLIRSDRESALTEAPDPSLEIVDWAGPEALPRRAAAQGAHAVSRRLPGSGRARAVALRRYVVHSRRRMGAGAAMLERGAAAVSDRFHAHIVCLLLGCPT